MRSHERQAVVATRKSTAWIDVFPVAIDRAMHAFTPHAFDSFRGQPVSGIPVALARPGDERSDESNFRSACGNEGRLADLLGDVPLAFGTYGQTLRVDSAEGQPESAESQAWCRGFDIVLVVETPGQPAQAPLAAPPYGDSLHSGS